MLALVVGLGSIGMISCSTTGGGTGKSVSGPHYPYGSENGGRPKYKLNTVTVKHYEPSRSN